MVRFARWEDLSSSEIQDSKRWSSAPKSHVGMLVKHDKLMQIAEVLYKGEIFRVRSVFVEKAGKKDFSSPE